MKGRVQLGCRMTFDEEDDNPPTNGEAGQRTQKRGRPKSWIHGYCHRENDDLVCEVKVHKLVEGVTVMLPCGKTKYVSGNAFSTKSMMNHLMVSHKFT